MRRADAPLPGRAGELNPADAEWAAAAWHEAGHAVAQAAQGLPLFDAAIWWKTKWRITGRWYKALGAVRPTEDGGYWADDDDVDGTVKTIIAALAGPEAEARYLAAALGTPLAEARADLERKERDGDFANVADCLPLTPLTREQADRLAAAFVTEHEDRIREIAVLLQARGTLTGDEIRAATAEGQPLKGGSEMPKPAVQAGNSHGEGPAVQLAPAADLPEVGYAGTRAFDHSLVTAAGGGLPDVNKPSGGLWLSPVRRGRGGRVTGTAWTEYCARESYGPADPVVSPVRLSPMARIAVISGPQDYTALASAAGTVPGRRAGGSGPVSLDWARVAVTADAVWLTRRGLIRLDDWGQPFRHWAVETVVVLNPSALAPEQRKHGSEGPPAAPASPGRALLPRPGSMAAGNLGEARRSAVAQAGWLSGIAEGSDQLENDLIAGGITAVSGTLQAVRAARESTAAAARAWQQVDAYLGRHEPGAAYASSGYAASTSFLRP